MVKVQFIQKRVTSFFVRTSGGDIIFIFCKNRFVPKNNRCKEVLSQVTNSDYIKIKEIFSILSQGQVYDFKKEEFTSLSGYYKN